MIEGILTTDVINFNVPLDSKLSGKEPHQPRSIYPPTLHVVRYRPTIMHRRFLNAITNHGSNHESDKSSSNGTTPTPLTLSCASERSDNAPEFEFQLDQSPLEIPDPIDVAP